MTESSECQHCGGRQWSYTALDDGGIEAVPCVCLKRERLLSFLGPLARYKHAKSGLWDPTTGEDWTTKDVFLEGDWTECCRHLKWVLAGKYRTTPNFNYRIVDDAKLLKVWLGDYAYKSRSMANRDRVEVYNNLADLLEDPSLVIIRLGVMAYANRAAGDVFYEALQVRSHLGKPTWVCEGSILYAPGHRFYSEGAHTMLHSTYASFNVGGQVEAARKRIAAVQQSMDFAIETGSVDSDDMPDPQVVDIPLPQSKPKKKRQEPSGDLDLLPPGEGSKKKKKGRW